MTGIPKNNATSTTNNNSKNKNNNNTGGESNRRRSSSFAYYILVTSLISVAVGFLAGAVLRGGMHPATSITFQSLPTSSRTRSGRNGNVNVTSSNILLISENEDEWDDRCIDALNSIDQDFDRRRSLRWLYEAEEFTSAKIVPFKKIFDVFEPESFCMTEERFGQQQLQEFGIDRHGAPERFNSFGDGPMFLCGVDMIMARGEKKEDTTGASCLVYSVSFNNKMLSFEKAVVEHMPNCKVHIFDPILPAKKMNVDGLFTVHPWAFGQDGKNVTTRSRRSNFTKTFQMYSFATVYKRLLRHEGRTIDILKIDCENCEFAVMPPIFEAIADGLIEIDQILIELHANILNNNETGFHLRNLQRVFHAADRANMRIFDKERNHWRCPTASCVSFSFASHSFLRRANAQVICGAPIV